MAKFSFPLSFYLYFTGALLEKEEKEGESLENSLLFAHYINFSLSKTLCEINRI